MNKNIDKNIFCQQINYFCQYLQYARFKRMGLWKESNNCHVFLEQKCKLAKFPSDFFWFNNKKFDNFWDDLFRNRDGFCSMFYRYTMHSEDILKFMNSFYMNRTRKPTKGLSVIELYVQEEALIRVDKLCQSFLVSFFLYITVQDSIKLLVTITDKIFNSFFFQFVIQHTMKILPDNLTSFLTLRCCKCNWVGRRWRDSTLQGVLW